MRDAIPFVQVIIVTWNKKKEVLALLGQLGSIAYPTDRLSILVVDNASTDGTTLAIETDHPQVTLLKNRENLGGAGGFNTGMRWTLAHCPHIDYLWLLDNDVCVESNTLDILVQVMERHPRAALCGSRIMDVDQRDQLIEVGAFIDYRRGGVLRHEPDPQKLKDQQAVFQVDYVAACSLLARVPWVQQEGIWHEPFFIYWDDMEWGARFRAAGYEVLAANGSVVYHPSWANRSADETVIWRSYYRTRNSLWFFNQYTSALRKRWLLCKMISRFCLYALHSALTAANGLSQAFVQGVEDFFGHRYGKKPFVFSPASFVENIVAKKIEEVVLFVPDLPSSPPARRLAEDLARRFTHLRIHCIVPEKARPHWRDIPAVKHRLYYKRKKSGGLTVAQKYQIGRFLQSHPWQVLVCTAQAPKLGTLWGRPVIKIDYPSQKTLSMDKLELRQVARILLKWPAMVIRALLLPPPKDPQKTHRPSGPDMIGKRQVDGQRPSGNA